MNSFLYSIDEVVDDLLNSLSNMFRSYLRSASEKSRPEEAGLATAEIFFVGNQGGDCWKGIDQLRHDLRDLPPGTSSGY